MLPLIALALVLPTTWIVDQNNGPGTNFTNLPAAVAAAASGDTIIVRPGTYQAFSVSGKALTILGAGASTTNVYAGPTGGTQIQAIPAGGTFYISGLGFRALLTGVPPIPNSALRILASSGPVVLSGVVAQAQLVTLSPPIPGMWVSNAEVHASRCAFSGSLGDLSTPGGSGARMTNAVFVADESTFTGATGGFGNLGGPGLDLQGGFAVLSHSSANGGNGVGGVAVNVGASGFLRAAGTSVDSFAAGFISSLGTPAVSAASGSSAVLHGTITLVPAGTAAPTSGAVTVGAPALPYLAITGTAAPGGDLDATMPVTATFTGHLPSAPFALVIGVAPAFSSAFAPLLLGELLVSFQGASISEGVLDALGMVQFVVVPAASAPAIVGVPVYLQFGVLDATAGNVRMSNGQIRRFQ